MGAYQISGRKAYVYILYAESAPHSSPTVSSMQERKYGIGAALIAFGIKFSIDNGCRGDVVFEAKTEEPAKHYARDFHAKQIPSASSGGPKRFMLADEDAWHLFSAYLTEGGIIMSRNPEDIYTIDILAEQSDGYFALPSAENMEYTDLLFDVCEQFGIRYYSAASKERHFVEEVTRVTWSKMREKKAVSNRIFTPPSQLDP